MPTRNANTPTPFDPLNPLGLPQPNGPSPYEINQGLAQQYSGSPLPGNSGYIDNGSAQLPDATKQWGGPSTPVNTGTPTPSHGLPYRDMYGYTPQQLDALDDDQRKVYAEQVPAIQLINDLGNQFGVAGNEDGQFNNLVNQYAATIRLFAEGKDKDGAKQYTQQFMTQLPQLLGQLSMQQQQEARMKAYELERTARIMSLQSQFAPIFQSIATQTGANNQLVYEQMLKSADGIRETDPGLASAIEVNAGTTKSSSDALLAAYAQQIAMTPTYVADMLYRSQQERSLGIQPSQGGGYQGLINAYSAATTPLT